MYGRLRSCGAVLLLAGGLWACRLPAAEPIAPEQFSSLHKLLLPRESEQAWLGIPWRVSLWEARREAAAAGKPILLWEMDGHPLGCT